MVDAYTWQGSAAHARREAAAAHLNLPDGDGVEGNVGVQVLLFRAGLLDALLDVLVDVGGRNLVGRHCRETGGDGQEMGCDMRWWCEMRDGGVCGMWWA
jgi:hypothetical protein